METEENRQEAKEEEVGEIWYPNLACGWTEKPKQENILFRNATIWTNEKEGILTTADIAISNGKIIAIGEALLGQEIFDKTLFSRNRCIRKTHYQWHHR